MPFVVEDGSAKVDATAYCAVVFADTYHDDRGHGSWAAFTDDKKKQCIVRATDYIDKRFGRRFRGRRVQRSQARQWPRVDVMDDDRMLLYTAQEMPRELQEACAEYALRAGLVGELAPDPMAVVPPQDLSPDSPTVLTEWAGGQVKRTSEKVDVLEETKSFTTAEDRIGSSRGKAQTNSLVAMENLPEYPAADLLLEVLLTVGKRRLARG